MEEDNLYTAIIIGVSVFIGILTVSAIIIFFNSSLDLVRNVGGGYDYSRVYRGDIESTLLMSNTGNYIKGTSVRNLINYYVQDVHVEMILTNIKYIDSSGNIQSYPDITIHSKDNNLRKYNFDRASRYLMDNQDFVITVDELDSDVGSMIITIRGV